MRNIGIYLDNAATTQPEQQVIEAMLPYFTEKWYNPSSLYSKAKQVKKDIEKARKVIGDFINADNKEIFFTSGGSESNNWAIQGFVSHCYANGQKPMVITSVIEHKSIMSCIENIDKSPHHISVNKEGFIDINQLENILYYFTRHYYQKVKILVSVQFANNEIGTIQHIKEISKLCHKYNAIFHTDAVQAFGQVPIDVNELGIDMLSASGHKIGSPKGIGILYKKGNVNINPLIYGSQENGLRGGTENVPHIIGMTKAVELCNSNFEEVTNNMIDIRNYMISQLTQKFSCKINGCEHWRLPNNINVTFPQNITGEALIYMLDTCGVYVSSGSACNTYSNQPSYVLKGIGLTDEEIMKTIRITLPDNISKKQIDEVIYEIDKQIRLLTFD